MKRRNLLKNMAVTIPALYLAITQTIQDARMVQRCQIRDMGALGSTMPARTRQLVCPFHV